MAYTDIDRSSDYFETTTYAGGTTAITSLNFSPDWVWAKKRTGAENHGIFDSVRGATKTINSNTTASETTRGGALTSFDSNGWSMGGADGIISAPGNDYVAWAWRGSDSSPVSNTSGSITSTVSANTTSGFSIVSYTGTGSAGTVGHGLGSAPAFYVIKQRDAVGGWIVYHKGNTSAPETDYLRLDKTDATVDDAIFNDTAPTSSVFSIGINAPVNTSSGTYIAYCFAEKKGFSKFGSYTGNGSTDGTFVYTGFKPAFVMVKRTDSADHWFIWDSTRSEFNQAQKYILPSSSNAESDSTSFAIDILSNGFKLRVSTVNINTSGSNYIYMAFAENPFTTSTGIPTTAR